LWGNYESYGIVTDYEFGRNLKFPTAELGHARTGIPGVARADGRNPMYEFTIGTIRAVVALALPRADSAKVLRIAELFRGWLPANSGSSTTITAPTTGTASNVARRAWKNRDGLKGTDAYPLARWTTTDLMVKASSAIPTRDSFRIAVTQQWVPKVIANLPDTDGIPMVAVSNDAHGDGIIVTAYWHDHGPVRIGG
tara:strand:+ start:321 stop:908 length:588 start_codon:yes stop_codon:yes gene_type:complete